MNQFYTITVRYFIIMLLMLLITGVWMLLLHPVSLGIGDFTDYYVKKSVYGLLEVVTPHLFAMGTVIFILTHFLSLKNKNTAFESTLTLVLFSLVFVSNLSMFFITETMPWLIWLKIISTSLFLLLTLITAWRVFFREY